ncbi:ATP-binding protein [Kitasatospora sp. MAP5-34]|uniref:ATP-binding protein n=1 Tax=Kitasatospora sp. MAP5-34 TaxID=3035102 RepID=UPI0024758D30|nr:ATP-binding protein [Kitasatospora sp. MAP5-34]MDH6574771.1 serine/threonine-protein kinase RsbW [Kitasatospora sp. MAP5-34]
MNALRIPAALTSLEDVAHFCQSLAERAGLSTDAAYRLRLATDELATNVVMHGYRGGEGELRLAGGMDEDTVWIRLEDDAPPFDPGAGCRPPQPDVPLAQRGIGGLGIHLALTSLDDFSHRYTDGHNSCTLVIRRHRPRRRPE